MRFNDKIITNSYSLKTMLLGRVDLSSLFLQRIVGYLYKAEPM